MADSEGRRGRQRRKSEDDWSDYGVKSFKHGTIKTRDDLISGDAQGYAGAENWTPQGTMGFDEFLRGPWSPWTETGDGRWFYDNSPGRVTQQMPDKTGGGFLGGPLDKMLPNLIKRGVIGTALAGLGSASGLFGGTPPNGVTPGGGSINFAGNSFDIPPNLLGDASGIGAGDLVNAQATFGDGGGSLFEGLLDEGIEMPFVDTPGGAVDMGGMGSNPWGYQSPASVPPAGGGGWWDKVGGFVKGLPLGTMGKIAGVLFGDGKNKGLVGSAAEYKSSGKNLDFMQNALRDFTEQLKAISAQADPFSGERQRYQDLLRRSYEDPNFMNTGPFKNWRDTTVDEAKRQASAMGWSNSPAMFDHITNRLNAQNMNYLQPFQSQVAGLAGGNINPQGAAQIYANGLGTALGQIPNVIGQREQQAGARGNLMGQIPGILKVLGDIFGSGNSPAGAPPTPSNNRPGGVLNSPVGTGLNDTYSVINW